MRNLDYQFLLGIFLVLLGSTCAPAESTDGTTTDPVDSLPSDPITEMPTEWDTLREDNYHVAMEYPADWQVEHGGVGAMPLLSVYAPTTADTADLPPRVHGPAGLSYVTIFPKGLGVDAPAGSSQTVAEYEGLVPSSFRLDEQRSVVYQLENGRPWAYLLRPVSPPPGWTEGGYVFAQIGIPDVQITCYDAQTGQAKPMERCDHLGGGDRIVRSGRAGDVDRQVVEEMLSSLYFYEKDTDRRPLSDLIQVEKPGPNMDVGSPLTVEGRARGYWYFEGSFPIELVDKDYQTLTTGIAQAQGSWMTEDWVPFKATLTYDVPDDERGYLIFRRANASGKPQHDRGYRRPVIFRPRNNL